MRNIFRTRDTVRFCESETYTRCTERRVVESYDYGYDEYQPDYYYDRSPRYRYHAPNYYQSRHCGCQCNRRETHDYAWHLYMREGKECNCHGK